MLNWSLFRSSESIRWRFAVGIRPMLCSVWRVHRNWHTDQLDFLCFLFCTPLMKLLNYSIQRTRNWINKKRQKHYYLISKWNHLAKCHKLGKYYHNTYSFIDLDELSISSLSKTIRYGISAISKKKNISMN